MTQFKIDTNSVEKEHDMAPREGGGDNWFKIKEGDNKMRILTPMTVMVQHYSKGGYIGACVGKDNKCPGCERDDEIRQLKADDPKGNEKLGLTRNIKWLCWIYDYSAVERMKEDPELFEEEFKLAKIPHTVAKQLETYQNDPEYAFSEAPMPYDVTLNAVGAGTSGVVYTLKPARQDTDLPEEVSKKVSALAAPEEIIRKMKEKKLKELGLSQSSKEQVNHEPVEYPTEDINPDDIPF